MYSGKIVDNFIRDTNIFRPSPRVSSRHMLADSFAFVDGKLRSERLIGQQREHRSSYADSSEAETVHDADSVIAISLHQRMIQREPQQELLRADAAIDQIDLEIAAAQHAVAIFQMLGRNQFRLEAFRAEVIAIDFVFAAPGRIAEFKNRNIRLPASRRCPFTTCPFTTCPFPDAPLPFRAAPPAANILYALSSALKNGFLPPTRVRL